MFSRAKSREVGIILVPAVRDCSGSRDFAFPEQGKLGEQSQTPLFPRAHADPALKDFLLITFLSARGRVESSCLELFGAVWRGTGCLQPCLAGDRTRPSCCSAQLARPVPLSPPGLCPSGLLPDLPSVRPSEGPLPALQMAPMATHQRFGSPGCPHPDEVTGTEISASPSQPWEDVDPGRAGKRLKITEPGVVKVEKTFLANKSPFWPSSHVFGHQVIFLVMNHHHDHPEPCPQVPHPSKPKRFLGTSRDGNPSTALCQGWTTLFGKNLSPVSNQSLPGTA